MASGQQTSSGQHGGVSLSVQNKQNEGDEEQCLMGILAVLPETALTLG